MRADTRERYKRADAPAALQVTYSACLRRRMRSTALQLACSRAVHSLRFDSTVHQPTRFRYDTQRVRLHYTSPSATQSLLEYAARVREVCCECRSYGVATGAVAAT